MVSNAEVLTNLSETASPQWIRFLRCLVPFIGLVALFGGSPASASTRIGNFLVGAPCGVAWVVDDSAAFVLDTGAPYVAGSAAPDDSYHAQRFGRDGANVVFEWGRVGDNIVGRLSADKQVALDLSLSSGWPGWKSTFTMTPDGANGVAQSTNGQVKWALRTSPAPKSTSTSKLTFLITPASPVLFAAGLKRLPEFASIDQLLKKARDKYAATRPQASGELGDFVGAIADNMNNSRLYSSDNHLVAHSVSRGWGQGNPNTNPYFCWDSFFTANLAAVDDPVTARNTVRAILSYQTQEGLVPNFAHWMAGSSTDRSQPPVASLCVWKMHQRYLHDGKFLAEIYPKLVRWHDWWLKSRNARHDGLLEWGSSTGVFQDAQYETGWDDNLHYAGAAMRGATMDAYSIDLSAMWSMDTKYLALIATFLGHQGDAARFRSEQAAMNQRINTRLWDDRLNVYCSRFWDDTNQGAFLTRLTPMNFYPLSAGAPDPERAQRVLQVLTDPRKFWGQYLLPTLAYDDPDYHQQEYWRGDIWGPVNYIVWQGIKQYASPEQITEYADRSIALFMRNWLTQGVCAENYLSTDGNWSHDPHYTWGALLDLIGLESIVDVDDSGKIVLNGVQTKAITLKNIPLLGRTYDVKTTPGKAELIRNGRVILTAKGTVVRSAIR